MRAAALVLLVGLAACDSGGSTGSGASPPTAGASASAVIVDDITCVKLVNHTVDLHVAAKKEAAKNPETVAKIRRDAIAACEVKWSKAPASELDKRSARCAIKATTSAEVDRCAMGG